MVRVRCTPRDISVLCFCLAMSAQPLVARKRSTPRVMSVLHFGLAKADQPLVVRDCDARPVECPYSLWSGQGRTSLDGTRALHSQGHVRFTLLPSDVRPAIGGPQAKYSQGHVRFAL